MKIFMSIFHSLDNEIVSISLISEDNRKFYAEIKDVDKNHIKKEILGSFLLNKFDEIYPENRKGNNVVIKSNIENVSAYLTDWLNQFNNIELWIDNICENYYSLLNIIGKFIKIRNIKCFDIDTYIKIKCSKFTKEDIINSFGKDKYNSLHYIIKIKNVYCNI